jgi:hypothetical protein
MDKGLREGTPPWVCRWRRACGPPRVLVGRFGDLWLVAFCSFLLLQELPKERVIELVSTSSRADEESSIC